MNEIIKFKGVCIKYELSVLYDIVGMLVIYSVILQLGQFIEEIICHVFNVGLCIFGCA